MAPKRGFFCEWSTISLPVNRARLADSAVDSSGCSVLAGMAPSFWADAAAGANIPHALDNPYELPVATADAAIIVPVAGALMLSSTLRFLRRRGFDESESEEVGLRRRGADSAGGGGACSALWA